MNAQQINANFEALFNAIKARNAAQFSRDNVLMSDFMFKSEKSIKLGMREIKNDVFLNYIATQKNERNTVHADQYCAVKVNVKLMHFLSAVGLKNSSAIDGYSAAIIVNTFVNDNCLSSKSALVTLTKNLEYDALDAVQRIKNRCRVQPSTTGTQLSSSKEALRIFALSNGIKNARNAVITLTESGIKLFAPLLGFDNVASEETEIISA